MTAVSAFSAVRLRSPARLEERWEVAAAAELGNVELDPARARLPAPLAVAVALRLTLRIARAVRRSGSRVHFGLHQPFGSQGEHRAHEVAVGTLLDQRDQGQSVVVIVVSVQRVQARNSNLSRRPTVTTECSATAAVGK